MESAGFERSNTPIKALKIPDARNQPQLSMLPLFPKAKDISAMPESRKETLKKVAKTR